MLGSAVTGQPGSQPKEGVLGVEQGEGGWRGSEGENDVCVCVCGGGGVRAVLALGTLLGLLPGTPASREPFADSIPTALCASLGNPVGRRLLTEPGASSLLPWCPSP